MSSKHSAVSNIGENTEQKHHIDICGLTGRQSQDFHR